MISVLASLIAGLGLFFVGLHFLTEHLKMLSGSRLRRRIASLTKHPLQGIFWGGVLISITQSTAATTFILIGMMRSRMMDMRQALPILVGTNMLAWVIVLVLVFDIKAAIFFVLGLAGFIYTNDKARSWRTLAGAVFGIALLFLGLSTMQAGVAPFADTPLFDRALEWTRGSYMLGLLIGAGLSFLVQSSLAVTVLAIALQHAGLFSLSESIMVVYGSSIGSSFLTLALSSGLQGQSKQLAMFQTAYNFISAIILVPLFYLEIYGNVPLVRAMAMALSQHGGTQIAMIKLIFNAVPGVILLILIKPCIRTLERFWPETPEEQASKPKYLHEHATDDADTALQLIEMEQARLLKTLSISFNAMREGADRSQLPALHEAFEALSRTIREAITDLSGRPMGPETYDRLDKVLNLQHSIETASTEVMGLGTKVQALRRTPSGRRFAKVVVEGLDTVLLTLVDVAEERSDQHFAVLGVMTSEDGIGRVRKAYLAEESGLDAQGRMQLLAAANHCERLIWLFGEMGRTCMALSDTRESH